MQGTISYLNEEYRQGRLVPNHDPGAKWAFNEKCLAKGVVWDDLKVNLIVTYSVRPDCSFPREVRPI